MKLVGGVYRIDNIIGGNILPVDRERVGLAQLLPDVRDCMAKAGFHLRVIAAWEDWLVSERRKSRFGYALCL